MLCTICTKKWENVRRYTVARQFGSAARWPAAVTPNRRSKATNGRHAPYMCPPPIRFGGMATPSLYSHLCQPRRLASRAACDAESHNMSVWCAPATWYPRTSVCDFQEAARSSARSSRTRDELHRCLRERRATFAERSVDGGLAIVESMTANYYTAPGVPLREEHKRTAHNIRCWARRHNYSLVLHSVALSELREGYSAAYGPRRVWRGVEYDKINDVRHRVAARYLERGYGHVLHIDTDTIALNDTRSLRRFLRHPAAVQLQIRENGEVAGATVRPREHSKSKQARALTDPHCSSSCPRVPRSTSRAARRSLHASSGCGTRSAISPIGTHGRCSIPTTASS